MTKAPDTHESARVLIVRDVIRGLYEGRFVPGQRLHEAKFTAAYGTSRGTVREAFNILTASNVVELNLQRGAQIRNLSIEDAIDILLVAQRLTALSARLAAANKYDEEARERLRRAVENVRKFSTSDGGAQYAISRDSFYSAINHLAANVELIRLLGTVRIHLIRIQFHAILQTNEGRYKDYVRIADAILAGKPRAAEAAVHAHLARSLNKLKDHMAAQQ